MLENMLILEQYSKKILFLEKLEKTPPCDGKTDLVTQWRAKREKILRLPLKDRHLDVNKKDSTT